MYAIKKYNKSTKIFLEPRKSFKLNETIEIETFFTVLIKLECCCLKNSSNLSSHLLFLLFTWIFFNAALEIFIHVSDNG